MISKPLAIDTATGTATGAGDVDARETDTSYNRIDRTGGSTEGNGWILREPVTTTVVPHRHRRRHLHRDHRIRRRPLPHHRQTPYGWTGEKRRSDQDLAGLITMGVRLNNPNTGRFLQVDPVPDGNANNYVYPTDPINGSDLSGNRGCIHRHNRCQRPRVNLGRGAQSDYTNISINIGPLLLRLHPDKRRRELHRLPRVPWRRPLPHRCRWYVTRKGPL